MKQKWSDIYHSPVVRNVGKLLTANVIAQAVGLLVYPILTRIYAPEDFGLMNLFVSLSGGLVLLATLEWYNAIVLPKREEEACAVVHLSLLSVLVVTVALVLTIPFAPSIAGLFNSPQLVKYYWLLPIYVALMGGWNILNYWYIRSKRYGRISGYQISQSLFSAGYKTAFGYIPVVGGLIYATVLSPLCSLVLSLLLAGKKVLQPLGTVDREKCKMAAVKYANFPKFSTPRVLLNYVVGQLPVLVLTPFFGARYVGFWGMALLLSFVPVSTVVRAVYQVMYQKTAEKVNTRQSIRSHYRHFTYGTLFVVLPLFALLAIWLPQLTAWLLGSEWFVVGQYIRWLLPWLVFSILSGSIGYLVDIFFQQKKGLLFEILLAVGRAAGVAAGVVMNSFEVAVAGFAISSALVNAAQFVWYLSLVRKYDASLPKAD